MKRKLLVLNLALAALAALAGWRVRGRWLEARHREAVVLGRQVKPLPPPPHAPLPVPEPVRAADYLEVAEKMLFSRDRNPVVIVEKPPEKPLPPLPVLYGLMDLGDGLTAIMGEKEGAPGQGVRAGEKIGPFVLASLNRVEAVLDFEGRRVVKKLDDLLPRRSPAESGVEAARAAAAQPAQPVVQQPSVSGPGPQLTEDIRACQPGDADPPGTVRDGYRKIITPTPFGATCRWERVR